MNRRSERKDEFRPEYDMKSLLRGGVRGKSVARYRAGTNLVLLEPEVAKAFPNDKAVNEALKLVMKLKRVQAKLPGTLRNDKATLGRIPHSHRAEFFFAPGVFLLPNTYVCKYAHFSS